MQFSPAHCQFLSLICSHILQFWLKIKTTVFMNVTNHGLTDTYWHFNETYCLHLQTIKLLVSYLFRHDKEGTNNINNGIICQYSCDKTWPEAAWEIRHKQQTSNGAFWIWAMGNLTLQCCRHIYTFFGGHAWACAQ